MTDTLTHSTPAGGPQCGHCLKPLPADSDSAYFCSPRHQAAWHARRAARPAPALAAKPDDGLVLDLGCDCPPIGQLLAGAFARLARWGRLR